MPGLTVSPKLDWGSSLLLKLPPRKLKPWFVLWGFFLLRLLLIPINPPYAHAWNTVVKCSLVPHSCYLELLDKLQKWIFRTVGPSLATSLEPLAHPRNVANLSLFYSYYFGRCSSELAQRVPLPFSRERLSCYSDRLHDFCVTIPRCYKDVYVNSFFPCTARLWNSLPIDCFPWLSLKLTDTF